MAPVRTAALGAACTAGDAREALRRLGQVDELNREYVDVCMTQQDLDGCLATATWLRTSYQLLGGDSMVGPTSLEPIFSIKQKESEDFLKNPAWDRWVDLYPGVEPLCCKRQQPCVCLCCT